MYTRNNVQKVPSQNNLKEWNMTIKEFRFELMMTQEQFAKVLNTTKQSVCYWEQGHSVPSIPMRKKINELAKKHNIVIDYKKFV